MLLEVKAAKNEKSSHGITFDFFDDIDGSCEESNTVVARTFIVRVLTEQERVS